MLSTRYKFLSHKMQSKVVPMTIVTFPIFDIQIQLQNCVLQNEERERKKRHVQASRCMKINWFVLNECHLFSPVAQIFANNLNVHYFYLNKNDLEFYSMTFIYFMNISVLLHINNINGHERFSILPLYIWQREN